jgi:hypothetical protein
VIYFSLEEGRRRRIYVCVWCVICFSLEEEEEDLCVCVVCDILRPCNQIADPTEKVDTDTARPR